MSGFFVAWRDFSSSLLRVTDKFRSYMRVLRALFFLLSLGIFASCEPAEAPEIFPVPESVAGSDWSYTQREDQQMYYYTLHFDAGDTGSVVCYDAAENGTLVKSEALSYAYTAPTISITFAERGRYDGYITEKGPILINGKPAHILQLFKVDDEGNPLFDAYGNYVEALTFWQY